MHLGIAKPFFGKWPIDEFVIQPPVPSYAESRDFLFDSRGTQAFPVQAGSGGYLVDVFLKSREVDGSHSPAFAELSPKVLHVNSDTALCRKDVPRCRRHRGSVSLRRAAASKITKMAYNKFDPGCCCGCPTIGFDVGACNTFTNCCTPNSPIINLKDDTSRLAADGGKKNGIVFGVVWDNARNWL